MPSPNVIKEYIANSYYHIYNRGVDKQEIFIQRSDYQFFVRLLQRYLDKEPVLNKYNQLLPNYSDSIELLAYCLMPNHFHLMVYQKDRDRDITGFSRSILTAYARYFNEKYDRSGPLFSSRYKAKRVTSNEYLLHISRYIHLNPRDFMNYKWSSLPNYLTGQQPKWLKPARVQELFSGTSDYREFVSDYKGYKDSLDQVKNVLASA